MNQNLLNKALNELPVHVSFPLSRIVNSPNYFKKLHLISDVLLGCFRLYGHAIIKIAQEEDIVNDGIEQSIETLMTKDSHGLWSSTIVKLIQEFDKQKSTSLSPELASLFGVALKSFKGQPTIKRMTVRTTVIDGKGQKQLVEVTNTPVELLINFRNKYVGHGTVYSEIESRHIYETYEPILDAFIESLTACNDFQFHDASKDFSLHGPNHSCSGSIVLKYQSKTFPFDSVEQLSVEEFQSDSSGITNIIDWDETDSKIIETYPYFLAHPYKRALQEEDNFKRLHLLKEVFLNYLKYLGLLTASEYFNCDLKIGDINRAFKTFLYRPQFGHWNAFMRSAIQALNKNGHDWFVKELPAYYDEVETTPYAIHGETSISKLINFRNHYLGHSTVPSEQKCVSLWQENFNIMKALLVKLDFCKNYTIVSSDKTVSWRLMGDEITQVNLRQKLKSNVAMLNSDNQELSIVPFFILPGEYFIKEISDRAKLMVYEQNTGSRIVFFSPESVHGETNNEIVLEQLNLMIREKEKQEPVSMKDLDEASWKAVLKENNEVTVQSLLSEKKVIKGIYQERQDAEVALRSWVGARAGLFFLAAEAGSGKTNLLVEMNRQYTERGLDTILLRGNRFRTSNIWEELCYRLNLTPESSLEDAGFVNYEQENPLMILIDGANENSNSKALFESIIQLLDQHKGGHIKIVLSWRVNTKSELPQAEEKYESIIYSDAIEGNREENIIAKSCHWLKPLNKVEVEGAWNKYVSDKQDKVRRKPNFNYEELTYHDRSLSDQLDNPLLLRLFLELNNGKSLPKSRGGFTSIWTLYHKKLISQLAMTNNHLLLLRLAELMLEHEQHIMSVDLLFNDEHIGDFVKSIQIDSPYQQLLHEGVLTELVRDEKLYVIFTVEGYFHYVLGQVIYNRTEGFGAEALKQIVEENKLIGVKDGVEQCLIIDVEYGVLSRMMWLIDNGDGMIDLCVLPLAFSLTSISSNSKTNENYDDLIGTNIGKVLFELFSRTTNNDIKVLEESIKTLEYSQKPELITLLYRQINERIIPDSYQKSLMFIASCSHISHENTDDILPKIKLIEKNVKTKTYELYLALADFYFDILEDYQVANKYYEKALSVSKDPEQKIQALINIGYLFTSVGQCEKALKYYLLGYELLNENLNKKTLHDSLVTALAIGYDDVGKHYKALDLLNQLLKRQISKNGVYSKEVMITYYNIGGIYLDNSLDDEGTRYLNKSLNINNKLFFNYPNKLLGNIYYKNGSKFKNHNDLLQSITYYEKSLAIEINIYGVDALEVRMLRIELGECYFVIESFDNAIRYFKSAFDDYGLEDIVLAHKIGLCCLKLEIPEKSLEYFTKCEIDWNDRGDQIQAAAKFALDTLMIYNLNIKLPEWIKEVYYDL